MLNSIASITTKRKNCKIKLSIAANPCPAWVCGFKIDSKIDSNLTGNSIKKGEFQ
jgi:hypothetical protein